MLGTTDWLLKRFLKLVLKRNVGKYLTSEIDLEQLDVKLDTGKLELRNLLLNCDAVNKDLALDGWHVKAGFVGSVNAKLPSIFSSSSQCSVVVNEVMLTVAPAPTATAAKATAAPPAGSPADINAAAAAAFPQDIPAANSATPGSSASGGGGAMGFLLADDFGWTGHGAVMDGIKRIAGSLQSLLQHMRVEASNVLVRVELPHPTEKGRVVTAALKLDLVEFGDLSSLPAGASASGSAQAPQHQPHQAHQSDQRGQGLNHKVTLGSSPRPHARPGDTNNASTPASAASGAAATASSGANAAAGTAGRREIAKHIQVKGLSLDLFETTPLVTGASATVASPTAGGPNGRTVVSNSSPTSPPPPTAPAGGGPCAAATGVTLVSGPGKHGLQVSVELRMVMPEDGRQPTQITTDVHIGAVRLQLLPSHAVCLSALKGALDRQGVAVADDPPASGGGAAGAGAASGGGELWASSYASASASMHSAAGHWGRRSLFESIMMPNCEGVVAHSLEPYMAGAVLSYDDANDFHDACSRFGSLASSLVSSVTQTGTNLLGYVAASGSAAVGGAMDWMGAAAAPAAGPGQQPASAVPAAAAQLPPPVAAAAALSTVAAEAVPQPVVNVRAHVSHAAVVLCYGPAPSQQPAAAQQQAAFRRSGGACPGLGRGSFSSGPAVRGATNGAAAAASSTPASAVTHGSAGSLVAELQDLSCDVRLDSAHGNTVALQAGQLQVYEQLPVEVGSGYGMTPAEWGRVPEVLPQAPYRFRPTQPAPSRSSSGGSAAAAGGCSPRLGARQQPTGRIANGSAGACASGALQTWPILSCASTHASGAMAGQQQPSQGPTAGASHAKPAANRHATPFASATSTSGASSGGQSCLRLRACWGGGGAAVDCVGYGRYGNEGLPAVPLYDLSVEVLPVTIWLSLPLVQRLTDFVAPLASEPTKTAKPRHHAVAAPKPPGPLLRLSLTVVAPHICVLLALVASSAPASPPPPRPPGTPIFMALDVVSPPHSAVDSAVTHHSHPQPHQHYHTPHNPYQQQAYTQNHASAGSLPYNSYGAVMHGGYQSYGTAPPAPPLHSHSSYSGGWAAPAGNAYGGGYGCAAPQQGRAGAAAPHWAWAAAEPAALLTVYQAPATDRLILSQITTIDLAAGVVELLVVRTAAAARAPDALSTNGSVAAAAQQQQQPWVNGAADTPGAAASWTCKSLLCLSPAPPQPPAAAHGCRSAWDGRAAAAPTGPADVPPGCGLHLHVCSDPGVGSAPDLVPEAWGHVAAHAQDRWADPDGEGGAWEERSSFRSVAFHERCRTSSATFFHLHAPQALLHLTRADLSDLAALPAIMQPPPPLPSGPATATARQQPCRGAAAAASSLAPPAGPAPAGPAAQSCVLLEIGIRIQLQDDPPTGGSGAATGLQLLPAAATQAPAGASGAAGPGSVLPAPGLPGPGLPGGLGLGLGGSRVSTYELAVEELTVFRCADLGGSAACNVTSLHAHGVTLLGHLEQQHQQLHQQLQQPASTQAGGQARPTAEPRQQNQQRGAAPAAAAAPQRRSFSSDAAPTRPHAICLLHCPAAATTAADSKQPSYIEYVCVEGRRPPSPTQQRDAGRCRSGTASGGGAAFGGDVVFAAAAGSAAAGEEEAMHSVLLQGVTVSTDHGYVTMDWAVQLGQLLQSLAPPPPSNGRGAAASAAPPPPSSPRVGGSGVKGHLSVNVVDLAVRHEPMDYPASAGTVAAAGSSGTATAGSNAGGGSGGRVSPVALALIIEAIHVGLPLGGGAAAERLAHAPPATVVMHTVVLHSLTLHLAAADQRGPGWTAADPRAVRGPLLQACGYHRVLQETSIRVAAKQRRYPKRSKAPVPPSDANVAAAAAAAAAAEPPPAAVRPPLELAPPIGPGDAAAAAAAEEVRSASASEDDAFHSTLDVEITNQHLLGMLTVESATLLAHFAMQAGTLMTARQAAAVAAAAAATGAPPRRDLSGRPGAGGSGGPADLYWDAASENGSSAVPGSGTCGFSEAGGDSAGSLLTALLLEEVDENAFRRAPPQPPLSGSGPGAVAGGDGAVAAGHGGAWYAAQQGGGASDDAGAAGLAPGGLILIDDFFPVNHQGEYDEDLTLVQHPPKGGVAAWRREGAKAELEGTWYGPDEGPDTRRAGAGAAAHSGYLSPVGGAFDFEPPESADGARRTDSGSGGFADVDLGLGSGGGFLIGGGGLLDAASEDPDIDDLLMATTDPRDGAAAGADPRFNGGAATAGAAAGAGAVAGGATRRAPPSVASVGSSSAATRSSSAAPTWRLQEDYVRVPRKSDEDGTGSCTGAGAGAGIGGGAAGGGAASGPEQSNGAAGASGGFAALGGGAEQPPPVSRITFKDLSGIWVMYTAGAPAAGGTAAPAGGGGGQQQEGRVELVVEGLGLVLESYGPGGHLARHMKLTVHDLEIRDCALEVKQQQQAAAAAAAAGARPLALAAVAAAGGAAAAAATAAAGGAVGGGGAAGWVRVLGYRAVRGRPRDSRAPLVAVALTAVRPNPAACDPRDEEFRLAVALLPLRLKLNQDIMSYLTWYGTSVSMALKPAAAVLTSMQAALSELDGCEPLPPPYFQRAQIRGFSVMLDYRPRRVDIGALAEGRLLELLNLVPLGGVDLVCKPLRLAGVAGWDGLGAAVLREWLNDIARTQAHKFITGLAPVNAVVKVGSAVATLVSAPARHLARRDGAAAVAGRQLAAQLRRTSATFAYRLVCEAMAAGRKAASGAGKALARVGSSALGAATVGGDPYGSYGYDDGDAPYDDEDEQEGDEEEEEEAGGGYGGRRRYGEGDGDEDGSDGDEGDDGCGDLRRGATAARRSGGAAAAAEGGGLRRSRSASAVVRKGLSRALGSASQQVAAAAAGLQASGLQRGVSSVARVLSAAAISGVSAAAPASAALQGQLKGTLRSVRHALRAQLSQGGGGSGGSISGGGGGGRSGGGGAAPAAGGYPLQPRPKED